MAERRRHAGHLADGRHDLLDGGAVGTNPGPSWHIVGSGDYDIDQRSDILWQNDDGQAGVWTMNGLSVLGAGVAGSFNPGRTGTSSLKARLAADASDQIGNALFCRASRRNVALRKAAYRGSIISGADARRQRPRQRCAHGATVSSAPSLPPDVPRTPGMRQTETQPAVSRHPAAEIPGLSRGHQPRGHTRTASTRPGRASYA